MGEEQCKNITVGLVSPPIIEVEPMSLTLQKVSKILCQVTKWDSISYLELHKFKVNLDFN